MCGSHTSCVSKTAPAKTLVREREREREVLCFLPSFDKNRVARAFVRGGGLFLRDAHGAHYDHRLARVVPEPQLDVGLHLAGIGGFRARSFSPWSCAFRSLESPARCRGHVSFLRRQETQDAWSKPIIGLTRLTRDTPRARLRQPAHLGVVHERLPAHARKFVSKKMRRERSRGHTLANPLCDARRAKVSLRRAPLVDDRPLEDAVSAIPAARACDSTQRRLSARSKRCSAHAHTHTRARGRSLDAAFSLSRERSFGKLRRRAAFRAGRRNSRRGVLERLDDRRFTAAVRADDPTPNSKKSLPKGVSCSGFLHRARLVKVSSDCFDRIVSKGTSQREHSPGEPPSFVERPDQGGGAYEEISPVCDQDREISMCFWI